jgi:hypothetical protein
MDADGNDRMNDKVREAERMFQIAEESADEDTAPAGGPAIEHPTPRVLPDLREAVSTGVSAAATSPRRPRKARKSKQVRDAGEGAQAGEIQSEPQEHSDNAAAFSTPVEESRRRLRRIQKKKLPRSERWKQRRLPPVCWK